MLVNGCDCSIVVKTAHREIDIPYSDETLREAVEILQEEASIEGDGVCRGLRKINGVTGCVVTPLTIETAPLLHCLAMGAAGNPVYISETRNLYQYRLELMPTEDAEHFDLIQDRGSGRILFEGCRVRGFELRVMREEAIKLKLDICGECAPRAAEIPQSGISALSFATQNSINIDVQNERFSGDCVTYRINGNEYKNIYGITLVSKKEGGTKTELWIKRSLQQGGDIPAIIKEIIITAHLLRDKYEHRYFGTFQITLKKLALVSDETEINAVDAVIGPLRYCVAGKVTIDVFSTNSIHAVC